MTQGRLFEPILDLLIETMPRDNLLNSACLEFFDLIKREHIKNIISHLVENYRDKMKDITYVDIFQNFIIRYDQTQGFAPSMETSFLDTEEDTPKRPEPGRGNRWENGIKDLDAAEEEYFNTSDDEDDLAARRREAMYGASPTSKPLVDYPSDEETENMEPGMNADTTADRNSDSSVSPKADGGAARNSTPLAPAPPERLSEKRRREEDEEDELGKLSLSKRRNSSSSASSNTSNMLRRKKSFSNHAGGGNANKPNKIAISLSPAIKTGGDGGTGGGEGGS